MLVRGLSLSIYGFVQLDLLLLALDFISTGSSNWRGQLTTASPTRGTATLKWWTVQGSPKQRAHANWTCTNLLFSQIEVFSSTEFLGGTSADRNCPRCFLIDPKNGLKNATKDPQKRSERCPKNVKPQRHFSKSFLLPKICAKKSSFTCANRIGVGECIGSLPPDPSPKTE